MSRGRLIAVAVGSALLCAPPAAAAPLTDRDVTAPAARAQNCIERPLHGPAVARSEATVPATGWVTARLTAASGDWDVGVFDASDGHRVAASAFIGAQEVAQGFATGGERLVVQACRRSGSRSAHLSVTGAAVKAPAHPQKLSLVRVMVPNEARRRQLTELGLDLTEHGTKSYVEVVLHGDRDAERLRRKAYEFTTEVDDLAARSVRDRRAESRTRGGAGVARLPSGRTRYRRLADYSSEMKRLAARYPDLVKSIVLPRRTLTGMPVEGIEITPDVRLRDGKPVFLQMGAHHAREWPSSENAMEWAYEMVNGWNRGDARIRGLLRRTRVIVVPVVNPEGFNTSREAGEAAGVGGGRPGNDTTETANLAVPYEYQRKNCRVNNPNGADPERGDCRQQPAEGLAQFGVDPNRNYGGFWGGPGASPSGPGPDGDLAQDYRGNGPFSERETQNIRSLVASRQVTTLITNHTFANLVLRPPGIRAEGPPVDEGIYKALGDSMAAQNGYTSEPSYGLYDTTGGTEDWSYYATGGLGFTFEIGTIGFHPPYADTAAEYEGTSPAARGSAGKGGNREAYFKALENTANSARHSTISGRAGRGTILRLRKAFKTSTSPVIDSAGNEGKPILFDDGLNSSIQVPDSRSFTWGINPSTRPVVAKARGRQASGPPSRPTRFVNETTPPVPCGPAGPTPLCYRDYPLTVPSAGGVDNARATIKVQWGTAASDYDITVYEDRNGDGAVSAGDPAVGTSAQGTTNNESATVGDGTARLNGKHFVLRVTNFLGAERYTATASFGGPAPFQPARTESYRLTCETLSGRVLASRSLTIKRGESRRVSLGSRCVSQCPSLRGGIRRDRVGAARLGRSRTRQRRVLGRRLHTRQRGIDRYCQVGGGVLRVGYPTARLNRTLSARTRRRVRRRAVIALSNSFRPRVRRVGVGTSERTMRRRLRRERSVRVGRNRWFFVRGRRATVLVRVQRRRVRELGLAARSVTRTRRATVRLLRAYRLR